MGCLFGGMVIKKGLIVFKVFGRYVFYFIFYFVFFIFVKSFVGENLGEDGKVFYFFMGRCSRF